LGAVLFCVFLTARTEAQQYNVTIDTTGLINTDQWAADFALTYGGDPAVTSTVNLTDFQFGGGTALGTNPTTVPPSVSGNESGSLTSGVTLSTVGGQLNNEYAEDFTPGNQLSFNIDASQLHAPSAGYAPDVLTLDLFDDSPSSGYYLSNVSTSALNGIDLLEVTNSGSTTFDYTSLTGAPGYSVTVTPQGIAAAPEISSFECMALFLGIMGMITVWRSRTKAVAVKLSSK